MSNKKAQIRLKTQEIRKGKLLLSRKLLLKTAIQETRKPANEVRKCSIYRFGLFESVFDFSLKANSISSSFLLDVCILYFQIEQKYQKIYDLWRIGCWKLIAISKWPEQKLYFCYLQKNIPDFKTFVLIESLTINFKTGLYLYKRNYLLHDVQLSCAHSMWHDKMRLKSLSSK